MQARLKHIKSAMAVVILMLACAASIAQTLRFKALQSPDLESIGTIRAILQDQQGFMWLGGSNGLARYDGYRYKRYLPKWDGNRDQYSISTNNINDLAIDKDGYLWVATYWGLNRYDPVKDQFEHFLYDPQNPRSISHNSIITVMQSRDGSIWAGSAGGGLNRYHHATNDFTRFRHRRGDPSALAGDVVSDVFEDKQGFLWVGLNGKGLDRLDPVDGKVLNHFEHDPTTPSSLVDNHVSSIQQDSLGRIWVSTYAHGVNRLSQDLTHVIRYPYESEDCLGCIPDSILDMYSDNHGRLWLAGGNNNIYLYTPDTDTFYHYKVTGKPGSFLSNTVIFNDSVDALWVGHMPWGVSRLDRYASAFRHYRHVPGDDNSLSASGVLAADEDELGNLWVGTRGGLNYINRHTGKITRYVARRGVEGDLSNNIVTSVLVDGKNSVWAGTSWMGISRLNPSTGMFQYYQHQSDDPHSLSNREVWSLYKDTSGQIWVGTNGAGLHRYRRQSNDFDRINIEPANSQAGRIMTMYEDSTGALWMGSDSGLFSINAKAAGEHLDHGRPAKARQSLYHYTKHSPHTVKPSIPSLRAVMEDSQSNMWFGTAGGGVNKWERSTNRFMQYRVSDGLAHNTVTGILEDKQGKLWFASGNGISRFNPLTATFRTYTKQHGLPGNMYLHPLALKTARGELLFGNANGLSIINTETLFENKHSAPTVITDFLIFNQVVDVEHDPTQPSPLSVAAPHVQSLTLNHNQSVFSFQFSLLNYDISEMNEYAYKLEGFDKQWNHIGTRHTATYTNLDPGRYRFMVKGVNNEGVWSEKPAMVDMHILAPWWASWWAWSLYVMVFFAIQTFLVYTHLQKKRAHRELEKTHKALGLTHQKLEHSHDRLKHMQSQLVQAEKMSSLGTLVAGVGHEINNPISFVNVAAVNIERDLNKFKQHLLSMLDESDCELEEDFDTRFGALLKDLSSLRNGTQRITEIVDNLSRFSRTDTGDMSMSALGKGLLSTLELVKSNYKDHVQFECHIEDDPQIPCAPAELNQVFMNLMVNACQAMKETHDAKLVVHQGVKEKEEALCIAFEDNGCGMSPETIHKIFDPFFTTKPEGEGTGLGMSISYGIIERHKGRIEVRSDVGEGTRIGLYLPLV